MEPWGIFWCDLCDVGQNLPPPPPLGWNRVKVSHDLGRTGRPSGYVPVVYNTNINKIHPRFSKNIYHERWYLLLRNLLNTGS